jgi:hypothetical protein
MALAKSSGNSPSFMSTTPIVIFTTQPALVEGNLPPPLTGGTEFDEADKPWPSAQHGFGFTQVMTPKVG